MSNRFHCYVKSFSILLSILLSIPVVGVGVVTFDSKQRKCEKIIQEAVDAIKSDQYLAAEDLILKAIETDSTNIRAYLILSDVSDELKNSQQKQKALEKIVSLDSVNYPLAYKLLATNSLEKGNYSDALHYLTHYRQFHVSKDSLWIEAKIKSCFFSINSILESQKVPITHLDSTINTPNQEYWPFVLANDSFLYFTRLIENERKMPLERIFVSEKEDSCWAESTPVNFSNDDEENIGTICFSADGNLLFFTSCGRYDTGVVVIFTIPERLMDFGPGQSMPGMLIQVIGTHNHRSLPTTDTSILPPIVPEGKAEWISGAVRCRRGAWES